MNREVKDTEQRLPLKLMEIASEFFAVVGTLERC